MANLCADPSVDIQLRLQLLETLELRSLGWKRHPAMADYYRSPNNYLITSEYVNVAHTPSQRALAAKSQTESSVRTSSRRQQVDISQQASSTMGGGSVQQQQVREVSFFLWITHRLGASGSHHGGRCSCFPFLL